LGISYAVFYLFATGTVSYYPSANLSQYAKTPYVSVSFSEAIGWSPWIVSYPTNNVVVSLPLWALISTISLAILIASYVALVSYMVLRKAACNRRTFLGVMGVIPASFSVIGCCSPTLLFVIGLASLTAVMLKITALLTAGSFALLFVGIYYASQNMIRCT